MRALLLVVVATLLVPVAAAQSRINPIQGDYTDTYVFYGRAIDSAGQPVVYGTIEVSIEAPDVKATTTRVGTDCNGFFIGYFTIKSVDPRGKLTATLAGPNGTATEEHGLDPFFRRSDFKLSYPGVWSGLPCQDNIRPPWEGRITVAGRLLVRVPPTEINGVTYNARPYGGYVRLAYVTQDGHRFCPPSAKDPAACDPVPVDERGDFRYSWTFENPLNATGHVEIATGNATFNVTTDPMMRIAFAEIETTGQGAPPIQTPGPALVVGLAAVALAALGARRLLPRHPR